jgi:iron complex transport system ATP-binding protein
MQAGKLLNLENLHVGYKSGSSNQKCIAGPINARMHAGELICLLGPNGSGKSTLIRTIAGLQSPLEGDAELDGVNVKKLKPAELARKLSLVLTDSVRSGNLDVYSLISLGRYPYSGWLGRLNAKDRKIIRWAIESTNTEQFIDRKVNQLSDGECQKVMLARALAQDTPLIILDEPTAHLDLPSRIELMRLLHQLARDTNKGILLSTHELDLALQVADKIWLLKSDRTLESGTPEDLVLNGVFESAFVKEGILFDKNTGSFNIHPVGEREISVSGEGAAAFWTKRALMRQNYVIKNGGADSEVIITDSPGGPKWLVKNNDDFIEAGSIHEMLEMLRR